MHKPKEQGRDDYAASYACGFEHAQNDAAHETFFHETCQGIADQEINKCACVACFDAFEKGQPQHDQERNNHQPGVAPFGWKIESSRLPPSQHRQKKCDDNGQCNQRE